MDMGKMFNIIIIKIFDPQSHTVSIIRHCLNAASIFSLLSLQKSPLYQPVMPTVIVKVGA